MLKNIKNILLSVLCCLAVLLPGIALAAQAGLVIQKQDGTVKTSCINFFGNSISGMQLLKSSNFSVATKNGFVVTIDSEGSKDNSQMLPGDPFWSYWRLDGDRWNFQNVGANYSKVQDGDVEGWEFGDGKSHLPQISFTQICPSQQQTSTVQLQTTVSPLQSETVTINNSSATTPVREVSTQTQVAEQITPTTTVISTQVLGESTRNAKSFWPEFNFLNVLILFFIFAAAAIMLVLIKVAVKKFVNSCRK